MAETIGSLSVDLRLLSAKFEQGVSSVNGQLKNLESHAKSVDKVFGTLLAAGAGAAFTTIIKGSLDAANRLGDLSTRLGSTVEGLSRLEYAAKLTGVQSEQLVTGLQSLSRKTSEAAKGVGEGAAAFNELGLSAQKLNQLRPEQQFEVLADALQRVPNQADRVRLSMKLMEEGGARLLQTMNGGSAAIRAMGDESDAVGATISTDFANAATAANAAMIKLGAASTGLTNQFVAQFGPTIAEVANWLASVIPEAAEASTKAIHLMAAGATESLSYLVEFVRVPTYYLGKMSDDFKDLDSKLAEIQNNLRGATQVIFDGMSGATKQTNEFTVAFGNSTSSINDFIGKTKLAAEATKRRAEAEKAAAAAVAEAQKQRETLISDADSIRESLLSEESAENESYARRIETLQAYSDLGVAYREQANVLMEAEYDRHQQALTDIETRATEERIKLAELEHRSRMDVATGMLGNLSMLMNSSSKKAFQIGKTAAIANALIKGGEAVVSSYAAGALVGGPIVGAAYAATAAAATAVQIQSIKSQQFGGGGTVTAGTSGGAGPGVYQPPQPSIPNGGPLSASEVGQPINIVFNGDVNGLDAQHLVETIRKHLLTTDDVLITQSSRNGQLFLQNF